MNCLQIKELSKTYPNGVQALDAVSLTLKDGMFGLLGPNGAGKSSLMRSLATLQAPTSGAIRFNDIDLIKEPDQIRKVLGYLPQEFGVYPRFSAYQLLDHIAILKGVLNKNERKEQVESLLVQTNLYGHRKRSVSNFSGGMRQRFGIAQALLGDPKLVIVDEPTAGLDPEERNRFLNLLSDLSASMIVILSTHIVEDVRELCTDMALLNNGKIITEGLPSALISKLSGKVWSASISKDRLPHYQSQFQLIHSRLLAGKLEIHVLADSQPASEFRSVTPDLEDLYFSTLHQ